MKIIECQQGSDEWLQARLGIVTASELDSIISPLWKARTGEGVQTYLAKKIAERWSGRPLAAYHGGSMEQGSMREEEAVSWYELEHDVTIRRVGFILSDDGEMGCSPDGLLDGEGSVLAGIEIKCPEPHTHIRWLLDGRLPAEHRAQVYGSMLVTGLRRWRFLSYCRGFPPLLLTIDWDEDAIGKIKWAVDGFLIMFDEAWKKLEAANGGPRVVEAVSEGEDFF